ncbi:PspC domain-containing protein [Hymenobacter sp.]|jgi:phage shock protein PspC (stress-responsive transcriptional regulator)|uniref:PspC domain-containing protein n=1 Tax=Hymenobacter sp. TaxID=1898978 RepID=UPI002EDA79A9
MKKNISINLQGIIFHIEEDGYEVLSRYLAEVKAHFSGYRGHEEIVADIEGRIAEIFAARLSGVKQVISLEDVLAMTAKMGRVSDFQSADDAEDDEELLADAVASGTAAGTYTSTGTYTSYTSTTSSTTETTSNEPRRLYRDMANRKVAGVAGGIARYFSVNPLWIRLGFLGLLILVPLAFNDLGWLEEVGEKLAALSVISYIILWIALPKRYDTTPEQEDRSYKKFYRDTDNGKVGGVSAGLAAYLNSDVTLLRVLFIAGLFIGGISFILYPLLWILVPEAKTISDKMRMRGDAVTLSGIDNNVRNNAFEAGPGNNRPVGTFFEDLAGALNPLLGFVGAAIRIFAGVMLTILGFGFLLALVVLLGVGIGLIPDSQTIIAGDVPAHVFLNGVPGWALLSGFLAFGIPTLAMLLLGIGLLMRRAVLTRTMGWSLFGLWLLSIIGVTVAAARQSREFQYGADVEQSQQYPALRARVLRLETRHVDREWDQWVDVDLVAADSGRTVDVIRRLSAKGASETEASNTAATTVAYTIRTRGDSTLIFDDHFSFQPNARYRDQDLELTIRLPRDRTFHLSQDFANWLNDDNFVGNHTPENVEEHTFRMRGNKLDCIDCTLEEMGGSVDDSSNDNDDDNGEANINLDFGDAAAFDTDESHYGSDRRTYDENDFDGVSVLGPYRVVIRAGSTYQVKAAGSTTDLNELRVLREGSKLVVRSRNRNFLGGSNWRGAGKILVIIETPELDKLELVGAAQADVHGFGTGDLQVEQAGASQLRLQGDFNKLDIDLAGACRASLEGKADDLSVDGAGGCELAARNFTARRADIDMVGGSKARLRVTENLKADAVGASVIEYSGNPSDVTKDATGASSVRSVEE